MTVQAHSKSLILVPVESASNLASFQRLHVFCSENDSASIPPQFAGVPVWPDRPCWGHPEQSPID